MADLVVNGEIVFGEDASPFTGATLIVSLIDTTLADAPSTTIATEVVREVSFGGSGGGDAISFELRAVAPDARASYSVRAHLDLDADGRLSRGDYVNVQNYPVRPGPLPTHVSVKVRRIP